MWQRQNWFSVNLLDLPFKGARVNGASEGSRMMLSRVVHVNKAESRDRAVAEIATLVVAWQVADHEEVAGRHHKCPMRHHCCSCRGFVWIHYCGEVQQACTSPRLSSVHILHSELCTPAGPNSEQPLYVQSNTCYRKRQKLCKSSSMHVTR
jgi:hypothetical protein